MTRRTARRIVVLLTIVSALTHAWVIARAVAPAQDAIRFAHQLRRFQQEPLLEVLRSEAQHPLYPMLAAGVAVMLAQFRPEQSLENYILALQLTSTVCGVLLVPLTYLLARQVVHRGAALWATALLNLSPRVIEVSSDGLSDALHLCLVAAACLFFCRTIRSRRPIRSGLIAGLASGAAYWVRPEGLLVVPAAVAGLVMALIRRPGHRVRLVLAHALAGLAAFMTLGLFVAATGRITTKATPGKLLGLAGSRTAQPRSGAIPPFGNRDTVPPSVAHKPVTPPHRTALHRVAVHELAQRHGREPEATGHNPAPARRSFQAALREYASEIGSVYQYLPLVFVLFGLVQLPRLRAARATILLLTAVFTLYTAMLLLLYMRVGYLSMRHVLVPALALAPTIGLGAARCIELVAAWLTRQAVPGKPMRKLAHPIAATAVGIAVASTFTPRLWQPLHHSRAGAMEAARWLRQHARPGDAVLDLHLLSGAFANLPTYPLAKHRVALRDARVRFVVIDVDDLRRRDPPYSTLLRILQRRAQLVAAFPSPHEAEPGVLVYELRPARVARRESDPQTGNSSSAQ